MKNVVYVASLICLLAGVSEAFFGISRERLHEAGNDPFDPFLGIKAQQFADQWITQPLDNFDNLNTETWNMRYLENDQYFQPGGPILIFLGGEWTISPGSIGEGQHITDMAKEFGGLLFYTEHRFYGLSRPLGNTSVPNLRYLGIDQALADLKNFITQMKETRAEIRNATVFVVGGSYSATMAAWMRQKYPDIVDGAWASSAPLHAKLNFFEYKEVMGRSIELLGGRECYNVFNDAYKQMEEMVAKEDVERLSNELNLCQPLDVEDQLNVWSLFGEMSDMVAGLVQTHRGQNIQSACAALLDARFDDAFAAYADWTRANTRGCFDYDYEEIINDMRAEDWNAPANGAMRQWIFQTCNEFGWYQTSDSVKQPFGSSFPVELYYNYCKDIYGDEYSQSRLEANVRRTNFNYGSFKPTATQVYYTHGQVDPWSAMGVQQDVGLTAPATVIPLVSHCADLDSIRPSESAEMTESKNRVTKLAREWLKL